MLAGLCRFYGGTPATYLAMPIYQLRVLVEFQPAIDAEEQQALALAVASPHMKAEDRRHYSRVLEALARPRQRGRTSEMAEATEIVEHNPALAAEWFASQGIRVNS